MLKNDKRKALNNDDNDKQPTHYFKENDWVKLKHHDRKKMEYKTSELP
jgi:hypothetical protein